MYVYVGKVWPEKLKSGAIINAKLNDVDGDIGNIKKVNFFFYEDINNKIVK